MDAGRILDAALSTIAVMKTGTVIAAANPIAVSTSSIMTAPLSLKCEFGASSHRFFCRTHYLC
jgi:hypothetical protein